MMLLLIGLLMTATSVALLVKLLPSGGVAHPLMDKRFIGSAVPLLIVVMIVFGVAFVISGLVGRGP